MGQRGSSRSLRRKPARLRGTPSPHHARPGSRGGSDDAAPSLVGIDLSKEQVDVALRPTSRFVIPNDEAGIAQLLERLHATAPTLIIVEATGGIELPLTGAMAAAGLPTVVVNPRQIRDFAKAVGRLAKTDALDAQVLAHFADVVRPTPRPLPDARLRSWTPWSRGVANSLR